MTCVNIISKKENNQENILSLLMSLHRNKYKYDASLFAAKVTDKIRIHCPMHGYFFQQLSMHKLGYGCVDCGYIEMAKTRTKGFGYYKDKANARHNGKFEYFKEDFTGYESKIRINCPIHGIFYQSMKKHILSKHGCRNCSISMRSNHKPKQNEKLTLSKGVVPIIVADKDNSQWIEKVKGNFIGSCVKNGGVGFLYIIKTEEGFYKIGVTSRTVKKRFSGKNKMPYRYEVVFLGKGLALDVWNVEKRLHDMLHQFRVKPKIRFVGYRECFSNITIEAVDLLYPFLRKI